MVQITLLGPYMSDHTLGYNSHFFLSQYILTIAMIFSLLSYTMEVVYTGALLKNHILTCHSSDLFPQNKTCEGDAC